VQLKIIGLAAVALAAVALTAACSGSPAVSLAGSSGGGNTNASLANAYLASGSGWVDYLQWNSTGSGSLTDDTLTGSPPNEQVSSGQTSITAYVNGSEVTFTGLQQQNGTLTNSTLTLQVLQPDGTLGTDTFTPATQNQFNAAVQTLQNEANSDNSAAVQQQAQASQASANAAAEQTASSDLATVQGISFSSDLAKLGADVTKTNTDLGTVKSDAANGPNGSSGDCYNLEGVVDSDVEGTIDADMEGSTAADVDAITNDIGTARQEVSTFQGDLSNLQSTGLPAPAGAAAAVTAAQNAISAAVSTANGDISAVNADVVTAYQVANGIATNDCDGPGSPPSLHQPIS
jgi:hypothetical protein